MFELKIHTGRKASTIFSNNGSLAFNDIWQQLENKGLRRELFYIEQNGRLITENTIGDLEGSATLVPRILGGKGGFGSMLRAIGAQIEKTTNREACRDLSGRRLRDINEEKRLKAWIEKKESRNEEEVRRKKRKLEKLCAVPKHEFKDQKYEEERSGLTDRVGDALEEGFKMAAAAATAAEIEKTVKRKKKEIGRKTILDDDIDSDELNSSNDEDDDDDNDESQANDNPRKKLAIENNNASSDSGCSSDESRKVPQASNNHSNDNSESFSNDNPRVHVTPVSDNDSPRMSA